jgi:hypothetical protein
MSSAGHDRSGLWFGLLGGAIAWTVHLMFAYAIAEFGCVGGLGEQGYLGITLVTWLLLGLTMATASAAGAATLAAYRSRHHSQSSEAEISADAKRHVAWLGVLISGLFTVIILFESIPILYYLHGC